ncbi:MAG: sugar O-acetyltransferase [Mycoplasmatales bacterium]
MTELQKLINNLEYNSLDKSIIDAIDKCRNLTRKYNSTSDNLLPLAKKIFLDFGKDSCIIPPINIDFGKNTTIGSKVFINYNVTILDCARVTIGDNVFIGPNVSLYTPIHPLDFKTRNEGFEKAKQITICDNVWLGGNVVVLPGVTIGSGSVIGAGSVVDKDIPENVLAFGNPCIIRKKIEQK